MIYALATLPHYRSHLEPVVRALGANFVDVPNDEDALWLVAGYRDLRHLSGRRVVLFEHGAGQSYSNRHGAYAGGDGRGSVVLFVCPNEQSAARNRARYPKTPAVVVGSPRVEQLRAMDLPSGSAIGLTWHWNAEMVAPEAHWALPYYRSAFAELAEKFEVLGHAHPRTFGFVRKLYEASGIEPVESFEELCSRTSVLVADNTSAMFEYAALNRPVVVANAPWYREDVHHGGRFWEWADIGPQVWEPWDLAPTIAGVLADPGKGSRRRRRIVSEIYPYPDATARAVRAIKEVAMSDVEETTPEEAVPETPEEVPAEAPAEEAPAEEAPAEAKHSVTINAGPEVVPSMGATA